jgi:hypothetical protein
MELKRFIITNLKASDAPAGWVATTMLTVSTQRATSGSALSSSGLARLPASRRETAADV